EFADKLLALKEPGEVTVVADKPEGVYYVAALLRRSEPYELSFFADAAQPDNLLVQLEKDEQLKNKMREGSIAELRREAQLAYNEESLKSFGSRAGEESEE